MGLILVGLALARGEAVLALEDPQHILPPVIEASIVMDDGEQFPFRIADAGEGVDVTANDHVYGQTLPTNREGMRLLVVTAGAQKWVITMPAEIYETHVMRVRLAANGNYELSTKAPDVPTQGTQVDLGTKRAPGDTKVDKRSNTTSATTTSTPTLPWAVAAVAVGLAIAFASRRRTRLPTVAAGAIGDHPALFVPGVPDAWKGRVVLVLGPPPPGTRPSSLLHPLPEELLAEAEELAFRAREPVAVLVTDPSRFDPIGPEAPLAALRRLAAGRIPVGTTVAAEGYVADAASGAEGGPPPS